MGHRVRRGTHAPRRNGIRRERFANGTVAAEQPRPHSRAEGSAAPRGGRHCSRRGAVEPAEAAGEGQTFATTGAIGTSCCTTTAKCTTSRTARRGPRAASARSIAMGTGRLCQDEAGAVRAAARDSPSPRRRWTSPDRPAARRRAGGTRGRGAARFVAKEFYEMFLGIL